MCKKSLTKPITGNVRLYKMAGELSVGNVKEILVPQILILHRIQPYSAKKGNTQ